MAWIIGNNPIIIKPDTGQCIKLNGSIILDLEKICADDVMVLPDRIGTGKTLYSYVPKNENIDQSDRAVSYNSGSTDKVFYNSGSTFTTNFGGNIPDIYKDCDEDYDAHLRLIPEKYLRTAEESLIEARNLPCALTKVVHSNNLCTDSKDLGLCGTYIQYGDEKVISKSYNYYIYPEIIPTPLSGVYDYHPLLFNLKDNTQTAWLIPENNGGCGSIGIYYKLIAQKDRFLVRPSIRYSLELSWENKDNIIENLYPIGLSSSVFDKIGEAYPLGKDKISLYSGTSYVRYKSKYGSTYSDTLSPTAYSEQDRLNLKKIRGIAIYNNYTNISSEAFRYYFNLNEVLFADSDDTYYIEHGLKYGLLRIGDKAFFRSSKTNTPFIIKTLDTNGNVSRSLPKSVNFLGVGAFHCAALDTLTLCNTQITNISKDCFSNCNFSTLTITNKSKEPDSGELCISLNTKLGPSALRNSLLSTINGLNHNVQAATFAGCRALNTITASSSNEITSIGDVSFAYCPLTNSSDLLVKVLPKVSNVGMGAFYNSDISGSIVMSAKTSFNKFAFANDKNLGGITSITFIPGSSLDDFCLYGLKNLTNLTNLVGCNLSSYALDGTKVVEINDDLYVGNIYNSYNRSDITGNNNLILTVRGTSGWFYDAFSNDSKGIRAPYLPVGVYLGDKDKDKEYIFYKFHPLGGGKSTIHSGLQDYYIHPNTVAVHLVTCAPNLIKFYGKSTSFIFINTDSDNIFKNADYLYDTNESKLSVYMFNTVSAGSCINLTKIVDYAFKGLDHKSFIFPNTTNKNLTYLGKGAFQNCSNLESVTNLEKLIGLTVILSSTFSGCDLESIDLPNTILTIGSYAFNGNSNLSNITFNKASTSSALKRIESYAFYGTRLDKNMNGMGLTTINNIISNCTYIGDSAFAGVLSPSNATAAYTAGTVTIPKCCTYLGLYAFAPVLGATQFTLNFTNFDSTALSNLEFWAIRPGEDTGKVWIKVTDLNCANIMEEKVRAQRKYGYHRFPVEINYSNDLGSIKIPAKLSPGS